MQGAVMEKERSEKTPMLSFEPDGEELERAQPVQGKRVGRATKGTLRDEHRDIERDEDQDDCCRLRPAGSEDARRWPIALLDAPQQRSGGRREGRVRDLVCTLETMRGFGPEQGVARRGLQFFQPGAARGYFAGPKFADPDPKLLCIAREFAQRRFEKIRECSHASAKGQNVQQTDIVKPGMLWRGARAFRIRREFEQEFVPRPGLSEGAQIKWLQGNIGLPDSGRQFVPKPAEQAIPIAADSKSLGGCLAADAGLIVPQLLEEGEGGAEVSSLGDIEGSKQIGLFEQTV